MKNEANPLGIKYSILGVQVVHSLINLRLNSVRFSICSLFYTFEFVIFYVES